MKSDTEIFHQALAEYRQRTGDTSNKLGTCALSEVLQQAQQLKQQEKEKDAETKTTTEDVNSRDGSVHGEAIH